MICFLGVFVFGSAVLIKGLPIFNLSVSAVDVIFIIAIALFGGSSLIFKAKALQRDQASKLAIYVYVYVAIMFSFDVFVLGTTFERNEIIGISIIFCATAVFTIINYTKRY